MRYGSVCSGIEAATVAWHHLGWEPMFFSEIEQFPCAVLRHHYPHVPNLGDMTQFKEWPNESIDLLVGGTPCQSFSVAGLRKGLDDPRGNLMLTFGAIAKHLQPTWIVWENVPGVLSSNSGKDFGTFLGMLAELGYGFAYRILDAQFFGVAQRRRRVFVVGYLGDWRRAAAVLFERESLCGHPAPSRKKGEGVARGVEIGPSGGNFTDINPTLDSRAKDGPIRNQLAGAVCCCYGIDEECNTSGDMFGPLLRGGQGGTRQCVCYENHAQDSRIKEIDLPTIHAKAGTGGNNLPRIMAHGQDSRVISCINMQGDKGGAHVTQDGTSYTLGADDQPHAIVMAHGQGGAVASFKPGQGAASRSIGYEEEKAPTLGSEAGGNRVPAVLTIAQVQWASGGGQAVAFIKGDNNGSTQETNAGALLRILRKEIGEEAFAKWVLGILDSLQPKEILRQALHGSVLRPAAFSRSWVVYCSLSRKEGDASWLLQSLRETGCPGCPPQGWEPSEQLTRELGAYLSGLSQPGAQVQRFMRDMWSASEGIGLLRQALSEIQEVGRSAHREGQSAHQLQVRRLTATECEFLQGFPRGYTNISWRNKPESPDGPRYKALGNSMAVPVMRWIGERIQLIETMEASE